MSRSYLNCPDCREPLAVKHHSGRIAVCSGVTVVILSSGDVELRCGCGAKRVVEIAEGNCNG